MEFLIGPALQLLAQLASLVWLQEQAQTNTQGELEDLQRVALEWLIFSSHHRHKLADILGSQIQTRLIALMWRLDDVLDELSSDESWITTVTQIREQLSQTAYQDIASMSNEMYPPTLQLGLLAALSALLEEHSTCSATLVADDVVHRWDYPTNSRIPFSVRLVVYQHVEAHFKMLDSEESTSHTHLKLSTLGDALWLEVKVQAPPPGLAPFPRSLAEQIKLLAGQVFWAEDGISWLSYCLY